MKVLYVLTIIAASSACLPRVYSQEQFGAWPPIDATIQHTDAGGETTGGEHQLYIPTPKLPDNIRVFPLVDTRQADRVAYPSLFSAGRSEGVIVIFGFPSCTFCTMQANAIPDNYRVLKVNKDESDSPGGPTWRALMSQWEVVDVWKIFENRKRELPTYPTTVIVVDGVPITHFTAFKPWRIIKVHSEKAKYEADTPKPNDNKTRRNRRNNRRDDRPFRKWLFGSRDGAHKPNFSRWAP